MYNCLIFQEGAFCKGPWCVLKKIPDVYYIVILCCIAFFFWEVSSLFFPITLKSKKYLDTSYEFRHFEYMQLHPNAIKLTKVRRKTILFSNFIILTCQYRESEENWFQGLSLLVSSHHPGFKMLLNTCSTDRTSFETSFKMQAQAV